MIRTDPSLCVGDPYDPNDLCPTEAIHHVDFGDEMFHFCQRHYDELDKKLRKASGKGLLDAGNFYRHQVS